MTSRRVCNCGGFRGRLPSQGYTMETPGAFVLYECLGLTSIDSELTVGVDSGRRLVFKSSPGDSIV